MLKDAVLADVLRSRDAGSADASYDPFAEHYVYMFDDWPALVERQANVIGAHLERLCGRSDGLRILDPTCGIGTQVIGLAQRGHSLTGTDISPSMIRRARSLARGKGLSSATTRFRVADLLDLANGLRNEPSYDAAVCCGNAIASFISAEDQRKALAEIREKVCDGAPLIIGLRNYDRVPRGKPILEGPHHHPDRERTIHQTWEWYNDDEYLCSTYLDYNTKPRNWPRGRKPPPSTIRFSGRMRAVKVKELLRSLELSGFAEITAGPQTTVSASVYETGFDELIIQARAV